MNLELLDPFARKQYPELLETYVYEPGSFATLAKFNRRGAMLASGCHNGKIVIWDFMTRSKALLLHQHTHPITSLSWSRDNKKLLSSSLDGRLRLWNVEKGELITPHDMGEPVLNASIHPRNDDLCVVAVPSRPPELVNLKLFSRKAVPTKEAPVANPPLSSGAAIVMMGALSFNRDGSMLYWGDSVGQIHEVDVEKWQEVRCISLGDERVGVKQIVFNRRGTMFLVNSNDRKIRLFDRETLECLRTFVDPVKKNMWKTCRFSSNSEFVIAGSADKAEHHIYIWDRENGNLVKSIEGPKEGILDLQWHPLQPIICSCAASSGVIFIWSTNYTEHWSAYAPNFTELHENEVYQEREDEFDVMDSEEHVARKKAKQAQEEEAYVDVETIEPIEGLTSEGLALLLFFVIFLKIDC
jgi:COMPASS component SWD1